MSSKNRKTSSPDYSKHALNNPHWHGSGAYVRVFVSLVKNPKFDALSIHAQNLYWRIALQCSTSGDKRHLSCVYPKSEYEKHFNARTFRKARDELLEAGFIMQKRTTAKGQQIIYHLSDGWYKNDGIIPEQERYF